MPITGPLVVAVMLAAPLLGDDRTVDHSEFDHILRDSVREEQVDYLGIRRDHVARLDAYLEGLADVDPGTLQRDESLAFHLNLYNAVMIRAVVGRFHADYTAAEREYGIFDEPLVRLGGREISLNQLENEVIRPRFQEPRIHVALVCAAQSCPPLIPRAYRADDLDAVLSANLLRFVQDRGRNRVDHDARSLRLSQIFHWYAEDFGGLEGVPRFFDRHHPDDLSGHALGEPLEYDWSLNLAMPTGRWVKVTSSSADLRDGPGGDVVASAPANAVLEVIEEADGWWKVRRPLGGGTAWLARAGTALYRSP